MQPSLTYRSCGASRAAAFVPPFSPPLNPRAQGVANAGQTQLASITRTLGSARHTSPPPFLVSPEMRNTCCVASCRGHKFELLSAAWPDGASARTYTAARPKLCCLFSYSPCRANYPGQTGPRHDISVNTNHSHDQHLAPWYKWSLRGGHHRCLPRASPRRPSTAAFLPEPTRVEYYPLEAR